MTCCRRACGLNLFKDFVIRFSMQSNKNMSTCIRWATTCFLNIFKEIHICGQIRNVGMLKTEHEPWGSTWIHSGLMLNMISNICLRLKCFPSFPDFLYNRFHRHILAFLVLVHRFLTWLIQLSSATVLHSIKHHFWFCFLVLWKPH